MNCACLRTALVCLAVFSLCGCQSPHSVSQTRNQNAEHPADFKQHVRNNCASLLYDLANDEKNLSKILIIKRESKELNDLVKRISSAAADCASQLEQLSKTDSTLHLDALGLPSGEASTREAIAKTKAHELLKSSGEEFQFKLLLTQNEALSYGTHLAKVAAENESDSSRAMFFSQVQRDLGTLHDEVLSLLSRTVSAAPADQAQSR